MQCSLEHANYVTSKGGQVVWYGAADDEKGEAIVSSYSRAFGDALASLGPNAFLSFDLDSIRAADMPAVSCPSPIGLSAADALAIWYHLPRPPAAPPPRAPRQSPRCESAT